MACRSSWAKAPVVEPASSRIVSPGRICPAAHAAMARLASNASPMRCRRSDASGCLTTAIAPPYVRAGGPASFRRARSRTGRAP
nr:hypothetical protein [Nonomuraea sp. FMUSA5-5]